MLEDYLRTMRIDFRVNLNVDVPIDHPIVDWLVEHCAYRLNKYHHGKDGRTAYGRLHGKETSERICELGDRVLWFVPKALRSKLGRRWRYGFSWSFNIV